MDDHKSLDTAHNIENEKSEQNENKIEKDKASLDNVGKEKSVDGDKQLGDTEQNQETVSEKEGKASEKDSSHNQDIKETKEDLKESEPNKEGIVKEGEPETADEEEDKFVEEPPPDPAAPLNLSDSKEALKEPFKLRPDQLAEVEQLWELFQNYTPAYTDLENYITEKELVYILKSLLLMTYTLDQLQELIDFCVRPLHPEGHITFDQFLKIVTIRQRDLPVEEELRSALHALDPGKTGVIDREFMKEVLSKLGHKMSPKLLDNLMKEVDISNDGTIGIEDVVGTMCIDLNKDDILMLLASLHPESNQKKEEDVF